jgi:UDP-2-acetamido-2,6-beta-L-arabino-hexul-4-ose reductase
MRILITGASGFIGKNLVARLKYETEHDVLGIDRENTEQELAQGLADADFVFHLAGVNRPESEEAYYTGNVDFTAQVCAQLAALDRPVSILFSSSTQAILDNPYGDSKRQAEEVIAAYAQQSGARALIYRLTNVFGKWCRPNYNSVVATFCHNIVRDIPIAISDPAHELELVHVDDVVRAFLGELERIEPGGVYYREATPTHAVSLGELAALIRSFRQSRRTLRVPDLDNDFTYKLYGTYLSYLETDDFAYDLEQRCDPRGCLAEFVKSEPFGQIFVSRTEPGVTRGNHWHHLKTEKFLVLEGQAIIRFRHIQKDHVIEYPVRGEDFRVLDIPPGYTHSIENVGTGELITLFWASEIFDPERPDTIGQEV